MIYFLSPRCYLFCFLILMTGFGFSTHLKGQNNNHSVPRFDIGVVSTPPGAEVRMQMTGRFQSYNSMPRHTNDIYDESINSPKSVTFTPDGKKFYIQSLEGYTTSVYSTESMELLTTIEHHFTRQNNHLFLNNEFSVFDYKYRDEKNNFNIFSGKPVESCLSHHGKYLWVTYYRRSFDQNAECPSALAIIDTETDTIVRVMPTGPLPKMIACSPDNQFIAVTHWGDNTIGIIDISSDTVMNFRYVAHLIADYRAVLKFGDEIVNRDQKCGHCLRGTVFTPDSKYLFVGKMGGSGGIAVFNMEDFSYHGTVNGQKNNLRHMVINGDHLFISTNISGYVQKAAVQDIISAKTATGTKSVTYNQWKSCYVGKGVRTIDVSPDGEYIFACINNESKISVIRSSDMKVVSSIRADAYPVGMAVSPDGAQLIVTSQGKSDRGGNSVMVFEVTYFR
jgi:DNA-binding beta-propeller fold protein YncE